MDPIYILRARAKGSISRDTGRYIGVTSQPIRERLKYHRWEARSGKKSHKCNWIRNINHDVVAEVIEWVLPMHREEREKYWIALFRDYGHKLTNATDGGEGATGLIVTEETRRKMGIGISKASKGKPKSAEHRNALALAKLGKHQSPQHIAARAAGHTGIKEKNATSRFHGVYWDKATQKWRTGIVVAGRCITVGRFLVEEDAARAIDRLVKARGLPSKLFNFP